MELIKEIHLDEESNTYTVDQLDVTKYPYETRLILYGTYKKDERLQKAIPFSTYLSWLNNDPDSDFISVNHLSADEYKKLIKVYELDPETRTITVPMDNVKCLMFPSIAITFPILGKLLEVDYAYYTNHYVAKHERTTVYYEHARYTADGKDRYVDGFSTSDTCDDFYICSDEEAISKICMSRTKYVFPEDIVKRFFNPNRTCLPSNVIDAVNYADGRDRDYLRYVIMVWVKRWFKYNPGKSFAVNGESWVSIPCILRNIIPTYIEQGIPYSDGLYCDMIGEYVKTRAEVDEEFKTQLLKLVG